MNLETLGWSVSFEEALLSLVKQNEFHREVQVGRVCAEHRGSYQVLTEVVSEVANGLSAGTSEAGAASIQTDHLTKEIIEVAAQVSGKVRYLASRKSDYPTVGDWVVLELSKSHDTCVIRGILQRKSLFTRKQAGTTFDEQPVAANVDTLFLVSSLNQDLNLRRIERYLVMAWDSGANPVIVLTKADLCEDVPTAVNAVVSAAMGVPIHVVSAFTEEGITKLTHYLQPGQTVALLGSSGVGKSTLLNRLAGQDIQAVGSIREADDRGRHTTTARHLMVLPSGGLIIDTPGMRELHLGSADTGFESSFQDVELLAEDCKFRDCTHANEPGCAVQEAILSGTLNGGRLESYRKLQRELAYQRRKEDERAQLLERNKWKQITKQQRQRSPRR